MTAQQQSPNYYQRCDTCSGYVHTYDPSHLQVGLKVSFTKVTRTKQGARFSSLDGAITEITDDSVVIKTRTGQFTRNKTDVTPSGVPNPLTYALIGLCKCNKSDTGAGQ